MSRVGHYMLWEGAEVLKVVSGKGGCVDWSANGVSIDSRRIADGDLFVAIKGNNFDGNKFAVEALNSGAIAALTQEGVGSPEHNARVLIVEDTMEALRALGREARNRSNAKVVVVTGSVGKTGTKNLLAAGMKENGLTIATDGNLNNQIGLPLSLARMPRETEFGVFEIGMNSPGEISPLSLLARPNIAIITSVEAVHIGFFSNLDGIANAKAEVFDGLVSGGTAIINRDNAYFEMLSRKARSKGAGQVIGFGQSSHCDVKLENYCDMKSHSMVEVCLGGIPLKYRLQLLGYHWAINSLSVLAAADVLGVDVKLVADSLYQVKPMSGRGRRFYVPMDGSKFLVIDESYNASPPAVMAALSALKAISPEHDGKKIAILGDMLELGSFSGELHANLFECVKNSRLDMLLLVGTHMRSLCELLVEERVFVEWYPNSKDLAEEVISFISPGDVVMVKGSLGTKLQLVVDALAEPQKGGM